MFLWRFLLIVLFHCLSFGVVVTVTVKYFDLYLPIQIIDYLFNILPQLDVFDMFFCDEVCL